MKSAISFMQMWVDGGLRETQGPNRDPLLDKWCDLYGVPRGSSWCAIFATMGFHEAETLYKEIHQNTTGLIPILKTTGSQALLHWFIDHGWATTDAQECMHWQGALIIRTDPDKRHGHVAATKQRLTQEILGHQRIVGVNTLEGNTDIHGGSNGDRAAERHRIVPLKPYVWHFCNTSHIIGGQWWS